MNIFFYLRFHTEYGQSLSIRIYQRTKNRLADAEKSVGSRGVEEEERWLTTLNMRYLDHEFWVADGSLSDWNVVRDGQHDVPVSLEDLMIRYEYVWHLTDGTEQVEGELNRILDFSKITAQELRLMDTWNFAGEFQNAFASAPFTDVLLPRLPAAVLKPKAWRGNTHIFRVKHPILKKDEVLCVSGSAPEMGAWQEDKVLPMHQEEGWWTIKLNLTQTSFPVSYKYGVYNVKLKKFLYHEGGNNRVLFEPYVKGRITILHDGFAVFNNMNWRGAGVSVPVFSLRSANGYGVGEFSDLRLLSDWAAKAGLRMIQILPVNDTTATHTWVDSYPYAAISAFALHPIYLNPDAIAKDRFPELLKEWKKIKRSLNERWEVDYEAVMQFKWKAAKSLFEHDQLAFLQESEYQSFFQANQDWLIPYAAFSYLRDKYKTADFTQWKSHAAFEEKSIKKLLNPQNKAYQEVVFFFFLQYHLHLQLRDAVHYAHQKGIIIKGDIPIGIYRNSVDAWVEPELYNMEWQAGAPPDDFAVRGQNWGFPTYNWKRMQADGFRWWKRRFEQMSLYFDTFRIDHILGFFRIWSIPLHAVEGIMGRFVPAKAIQRSELEQRNIAYDLQRYTEPYISDAVVWEIFDGDAEQVKELFLQSTGHGMYSLKEHVQTQRKVEQYFQQLDVVSPLHKYKQGLFDCISNVIFFQEDDAKFHFRFNMQLTSSFRALPENERGILYELYVDYFFRRQDDHWKDEALHKLPELKRATRMLICGEDLGLVPGCVPEVMQQLGILSLEIQRMPKNQGSLFAHPNQAPYLSVITPATHDMSTIRGWWEEDRVKTQNFFNQILGQWGEAPYFCEAWINKSILLQHLFSPAMWCVFQIQDLLGIDDRLRRENPQEERINVPANPKHYWRYRLHLSLEELLRQKTFTAEIETYVQQSGRAINA